MARVTDAAQIQSLAQELPYAADAAKKGKKNVSHISEVVQCLVFSVWLISLSIMPSRSIYVVANSKISYLVAK